MMPTIMKRDLDESYILSGRGPFVYRWTGNVLARRVVDIFLPIYTSAHTSEKSVVITFAVSFLIDRGMKFVKQQHPPDKTKWVFLSSKEIQKKCAHLFRDAVTKAKKQEQQQQETTMLKKNTQGLLLCKPTSAPLGAASNDLLTLVSPSYEFDLTNVSEVSLSDVTESSSCDSDNVDDYSLNIDDLEELSNL